MGLWGIELASVQNSGTVEDGTIVQGLSGGHLLSLGWKGGLLVSSEVLQ